MNPKLSSLIDRKPSTPRIILTDYASFLLTVGTILGGIFLVTIPIALLLMYFLIKRVRFIQRIFSQGVRVPAILVSQKFSYGGLQLRYQYTYQYKEYESTNRILRFRSGIEDEEKIEVFLNPEKPIETAFITKLYLDKLGE